MSAGAVAALAGAVVVVRGMTAVVAQAPDAAISSPVAAGRSGWVTAVELRREDSRRVVALPCGATGEIRFVNSVTGSPVTYTFEICGDLNGFRVVTDDAAAEYYTAGLYRMNERLAGERRSALAFCSEVGMDVRVGAVEAGIRNGCLEVRVLWSGTAPFAR